MIVEFTGCTGSGKTTISQLVIEKLVESGLEVVPVHSRCFNYKWSPFRGIGNQTVQNFILDVKALVQILKHIKEEIPLLKFFISVLSRYGGGRAERINLFRSVCRKIGVNRNIINSGLSANKIVIIDEGMVHSLHNLFVHRDIEPDLDRIREFSRLVPMPDIIVYVRSPLDMLIERARKRTDLTRRAKGRKLDKFIENADRAFEEFMEIKKIKERVLFLYNNSGREANEDLSRKAVEYILGKVNMAGGIS